MFDKQKVDYSLYLVTNNELVPEGLTIYNQVEKALANGVTIVQLREKELDTGAFIERAKKIHELTKKWDVPLIINDRVDVAMAVDAEGVHVGQDDMDPVSVRKIIGNDKILGVSTRCEDELMGVVNSSSLIDYVGIGTTYATTTKNVKRAPLGVEGVKGLLKIIKEKKPTLKSVLIGGLNKYNIANTLAHCAYDGFNTNGVAVVSCIMGQYDAVLETKETKESILIGFNPKLVEQPEYVEPLFVPVTKVKPLVHFITNSVVQQISANVCIAAGGSPIMSELVEEFQSFAKSSNVALVLNTGTPKSTSIEVYKAAIKAYSSQMKPIVYDPVGCGATEARIEIMKELLSSAHFTVIKGNFAELAAVAGSTNHRMKGVDSITEVDEHEKTNILTSIALSRRCVVVMTGRTDIVVDGTLPTKSPRIARITGGNHLMAEFTGSGCALGGLIASYVASNAYTSAYQATVAAVSAYKNAGYEAGLQSKGPGTFIAHFIDQLYIDSKKDL